MLGRGFFIIKSLTFAESFNFPSQENLFKHPLISNIQIRANCVLAADSFEFKAH